MSHFLVKVLHKDGNPAWDIGFMIDYDWLGGTGEKRTHSDGWVEFHNHGGKSVTNWVHGHNMGNHSLSDDKKYSFII